MDFEAISGKFHAVSASFQFHNVVRGRGCAVTKSWGVFPVVRLDYEIEDEGDHHNQEYTRCKHRATYHYACFSR